MRPEAYIEITLTVSPKETDAAEGALLALGAMGTALECRPGSVHPRGRVQGFFPEQTVVTREEVAGYFRALSGSADIPEISIQVAPWRDWATESQAAFRSFAITDDLTIAPPWEQTKPGNKNQLIINPGAAFGIGTHPTTRGCIDLIPRPHEQLGHGRALDVGTGTGILALRALQCGFAPVIGLDNDPLAVEAAAENARLNGCAEQLHLILGEMSAIAPRIACTLIIANIFLNPLLALAGELVNRLEKGGQLVLSGIRETDSQELIDTYAQVGAVLCDRRSADGWASLRLAAR